MTKAIIPAAGHGTRMLPVTRAVPKELLPVGSTPAIHWVIEEAAAAGLTAIAIVVSPAKPLIGHYLTASGVGNALGVDVELVVQEEQSGLADAIWRCRDFVAGESFGLLLPDNLVLVPGNGLRAMVELHLDDGRDVLGVLRLDESHSLQYGNSGLIDFDHRADGALEIRQLRDKRPGRLEIPVGGTTVRACGRYLCTPDVFDWIERLRPEATGELDEVPVYQAIIRQRGALGYVLPTTLFDVGHPRGFAAANAYWLAQQKT